MIKPLNKILELFFSCLIPGKFLGHKYNNMYCITYVNAKRSLEIDKYKTLRYIKNNYSPGKIIRFQY